MSTDKNEALRECLHWHEREDKALSKSGRSDAEYHWRRDQHRQEIERITASLSAPVAVEGVDEALGTLLDWFEHEILGGYDWLGTGDSQKAADADRREAERKWAELRSLYTTPPSASSTAGAIAPSFMPPHDSIKPSASTPAAAGAVDACETCGDRGWLEHPHASDGGQSDMRCPDCPTRPTNGAVLSDSQCDAVYQAVMMSGLTRDVKSPERKRQIVRDALACTQENG